MIANIVSVRSGTEHPLFGLCFPEGGATEVGIILELIHHETNGFALAQ